MDRTKMDNGSLIAEFLLLGLTEDPVVKIILFALFLVIYILTLIGNTILITAWICDSRLHTPMYFFLGNLSLLDICFSSSIVPYMLAQLLVRKTISFNACASQMYIALSLGGTECVLLAVMAYDRYVAIVYPLRYRVIMSTSFCITLASCCWLSGSAMSLLDTFFTLQLPLCGAKIINNFVCEVPTFLKMACVDIFATEMIILSAAVFILLIPSVFTFISYTQIIITIVRIRSSEARLKAFSTCASHLIIVTIFYSTVISMYMRPVSKNSKNENQDKMIAVFYTVTPPMLNPMIYSLRNKDVKMALQKITRRHIFH
ncbi:olfactory receptor 2D3-like [Pleurodeles waltl]|uniref:olfactory receptor 2D3-like n=1 Tax=Pleurodeles waltl TaxID=8319 RepID=UPI00370950F4